MKKIFRRIGRQPAGLGVRTELKSGSAESLACYHERNWLNIGGCITEGNVGLDGEQKWQCDNKEGSFRRCLSVSGEPDWWKWLKPYDDRCTDATRCLAVSTTAGAKCYNEFTDRFNQGVSNITNMTEFENCLKTTGLLKS